MGSKRVDSYYTSRKRLLVVEFDLAARVARKVVAAHYGDRFTDAIAVEARQEYESLTPQLPYIGGRENPLTQIMVAAGMFLALYKPLKAHGKAVEEIGALVYEAVERAYDLFPRHSEWPRYLLRLHGRLSFTKHSLRKARVMALESQKRRHAGDWVYSFVEGDGEEFDYGLDFEECGMCKFFQAQGAAEFAPYMCRLDFIASDRLGWGLVRTGTIAEGAEKCDFRYRVK